MKNIFRVISPPSILFISRPIKQVCINIMFKLGYKFYTGDHHHHQRVLHKDTNSGTAAVLPKGRSSTANSGTKIVVLKGMNKCGSFLSLCAPHSLFSIWTDLKKSEKIVGAPAWSCGMRIWLPRPSELHHRAEYQFHKVFYKIRDPEIPITLRQIKDVITKIN